MTTVLVSVAAPQRQGIPPFGAVGEPALACGHGRMSVPTTAVDGETTAGPSFGPVSVKGTDPVLKTFPQPQAVQRRGAFIFHALAGPCGVARAFREPFEANMGIFASLQGHK